MGRATGGIFSAAICTLSSPRDYESEYRLDSINTEPRQWVNVSAIVYSITVLFIKISILLQYLRIFVPSRKDNMALFVAIQITAWSIVAFYVLVAIFELAMCNPRSKIWHPLSTVQFLQSYFSY